MSHRDALWSEHIEFIAAQWCEALLPTLTGTIVPQELLTHLSTLAGQILGLLAATATDGQAARAIGRALSALDVFPASGMEPTYRVLVESINSIQDGQLSPERAQRLGEILGSVSVGFLEARELSLRERYQASTNTILSNTLEHFERTFAHTGFPLALLDLETRVLDCNAAFADLFDKAVRDIRGAALTSCVIEPDTSHLHEIFTALASGTATQVELVARVRTVKGAVLVNLTLSPMVRATSTTDAVFLAIGHDVSGRVHATSRLRQEMLASEQARTLLRSIFDATSDAMAVVSPDGTLLAINRRFEEMFGIPAESIAGRHVNEVGKEIERAFGATIDPDLILLDLQDITRSYTWSMHQVWPEERNLQLFATPVLDDHKVLLGRLYVLHDVTKEHASDQLKADFLSLVSHELRTPLTSVKGYVNLLLYDGTAELSAEQKEFLNIVQHNTERLNHIVNDLLDITRLDSRALVLNRSATDARSVVEGVVQAIQPQCAFKQQELTVALPSDLPPIDADVHRFEQVLLNLLSNASKYTSESGHIAVSARIAGPFVEFTVMDDGIGMTIQEQRNLFTRFYRAKNAATSQEHGVGLGLVITRALVELHGGAIEVTSSPGRGSTFSFTIPVAADVDSKRLDH